MRFSMLELGKRIEVFPFILGMFRNGLLRPVFGTASGVIMLRVLDEVHRQLTPHDELIEEGIAGRPQCAVLLHRGIDRQSDGQRADVTEVEVRRKHGRAVALRAVAVTLIVVQEFCDEIMEAVVGCVRTADPGFQRLNAAVEIFPAASHIVARRAGAEPLWALPFTVRFRVAVRMQKVRKEALEPGPDGVGAILGAADEFRWNDYIGVDGPERNANQRCQLVTPPFGSAQWVLIADVNRGIDVDKELSKRFMRAVAQDEGDAALGKVFFYIDEAAVEKGEVAQVGMRKLRHACEIDHERQTECIGNIDRYIERMIVTSA